MKAPHLYRFSPDEFERNLLKKIDDENVMRQVATVSQTSSGTLTIPYRESKPAAAAKDEKATYAIGNIEFLTTTIDVYKLTNSIAVTEEMLTDSAFNIEAEVTEALGETIGAAEEAWFVTGGGTTLPYGIVTGASAGVTAASDTAITSDELIDLYHALHKGYRARATWGFEDATAQVIRKLKAGMMPPPENLKST
jgi:HK97 family phage major capsid protein